MELNEKLQRLRKQRGLTQEEVAEALYVSRTAVSKWESGRGYPSIDSLKAIAGFYSVTVDELLSGDQVIALAEEERMQREMYFRDIWFGLLDCCAIMLLFLPFFGEKINGTVQSVSLLLLTGIGSYLKILYFAVVIGGVLLGILTLALQRCRCAGWLQVKRGLSLLWHGVGVILFILGRQPYAAVFAFVFMAIKAFMLIKRK